MEIDPVKTFKTWLKNEKEAIRKTYRRSQGPYEQGMRDELKAVENAFLNSLKGVLNGNG